MRRCLPVQQKAPRYVVDAHQQRIAAAGRVGTRPLGNVISHLQIAHLNERRAASPPGSRAFAKWRSPESL
jgi:hypothetical protein